MKQNIGLIILLAALFSIILHSCNTKKEQNSAEKGYINLSAKEINSFWGAEIIGEWEFYENKLYTPDSFANNKITPQYINVPAINKHDKLNRHLFGTYRIKIITDSINFPVAITNKRTFSSSKIFINNTKQYSVGNVQKTKEEYTPELKITYIELKNIEKIRDTTEIIIQIANFHDPISGIITPFKLENSRKAYKKIIFETGALIGILSIIFILGVFSFTMFINRQKSISQLIFVVLSLVFIMFGLATNDTLIKNYFLSNFDDITRITHISVSLYPAVIMLFFYYLKEKIIPKRIIQITIAISIALIIFSIFSDTETIRQYTYIKGIYIILILSYLIFYIMPRAFIKKIKVIEWAFAGLIILTISSINDTLFSMNIVKIGYLSIYGFFIYFIMQAMYIANNFTATIRENEELAKILEYQNKNLEEIIKIRTGELHFQKEEINARNEELQMQNEEIIAQREEIKSKNDKIKHQNSQTNSSIRYAGKIQNAMMPDIQKINIELDTFIIFKPREKVSGDFFWFSMKKSEKIIYTAVADCTGHGVPAAFMSMMGNVILNNIISNRNNMSPAAILTKMHEEIVNTLNQTENKNADGMDLCLCKIEKEGKTTKKVTFSGAKSPLYYIQQSGKTTRIKGSPKPIGGILDSEFDFYYSDIEIFPQKGDMIYLSSDGYIDQNNSYRERFGTVKFMKLLRIIAGRSTETQKQVLERELVDFMENEEQRDDITVWGIKF